MKIELTYRECFHRRGQSLMRSVRLAIVSLAVVGLAFGVYQLGVDPVKEDAVNAADVPEIYREWLAGGGEPGAEGGGVLFGDVPVEVVTKPGITIYYEDTLRKKIHMKFDNPRQVDSSGKLFHVDMPIITYYMKRGEKALIRADQALITSRETGKIEPQRGEFSGNVRIDVDRRTEQWRKDNPHLANRPPPQDLLVRMWVDTMEFDLDLGHLEAPGPVRIEANEMLLEGQGLTVRWSEQTGRVEHLKLNSGKQLVFKGDLGLADGLTQGKEQKDEKRTEQTIAKQEARPAVAHASPMFSNSITPVQAGAAAKVDGDVLIVDLPEDDLTSAQRIISYVIDFDSDVLALGSRSSKSRLQADHLSVLFDLATGGAGGRQRGAEGSDETQSGSPQEVTPGSNEAEDSRTVVTWSGPLEIRAVGEVEDQAAELRRHVTATGSPVVLENSDGRATSAEVIYHQETRFTRFIGSEEFPVDIDGGNDSRFVARGSVVWDMENLRAHLRGDVRVTLEGAVLEAQVVDAYFRSPEPGSQPAAAGSPRDLLEKLVCEEDVQFQTSAEQMTCRHLTVQLARDDQGRNMVRHAHAVGDVSIIQGERILSARDVMDVTFGDLPTDEQGNVLSETPEVKKLIAEGEVRILDPPRGWDIAGEKLNCEFDDQQMITFGYIEGPAGQHAKVKMGEYSIEGLTVTFDDARQWAHVPGAGVARFVITEDLDGRRTDQPVPVEVHWDKKMTLRGEQDILEFDGNAVAKSRNNTLSGNVLWISLTDVQPEPQLSLASADPMGMWFLQPFEAEVQQASTFFGNEPKRRRPARQRIKKRATYILADGNAKLISRSESNGRLESLITLEAPQIAFDLDARVTIVEHPGRLGIQDYPTEEAMMRSSRQSGGRGLFSEVSASGGEGPSQTLIRWDSAMRYYFAQRVAEFEGKDEPVLLRHFSGAYIAMNEKLKREIQISDEQLARLRASGRGRKTDLHCRQLLVEFERSQSRSGRGGGEMSIGELRQFQASGDVILDDPQWYITGDRLSYVDDTQLISIYGFKGQKAYIDFIERKTGRHREARCDELHVEMKTGYVDAPGCDIRFGGR